MRVNKHEKKLNPSDLFERLLIPMMVDVMEFVSRYPPFKEEEEKTVYQKDNCINWTGERAELHRPKGKAEVMRSRQNYSGCYTPFDAFHQPHLPRLEDSVVNLFSSCRHLFPVVERLDAFVCLEGVMLPILNNFHGL